MRKRTKILLGVSGGLLAVLVGGAATVMSLNGPLSRAEVDQGIEQLLRDAVEAEPGLSSALVTVYSGSKDRLMQYAVGVEHPGSDVAVKVDSRYHSASVGKTMLAAVFGQLVDERRVGFDDPIANYVDAELLEGLFIVDGVDHARAVTVGQLLSHTSGAADYFEGAVDNGNTMLEELTAHPARVWTPRELLAFSQEGQQAVDVPGRRFAYSDTGYLLLGFALERIEMKPYEQILEDRLFDPLGMTDSSLLTSFGADSDIIAVDLGGTDISKLGALSVDWSGGGVTTTMDDLLLFSRALYGGELVGDDTLAELTAFTHEMEPGIRYGKGVMQFRFSELSPLLFSLSDVHGAVGATGTFALYDPTGDVYYIANFGSLGYEQKAIEQLVQIRMLVDRLQD